MLLVVGGQILSGVCCNPSLRFHTARDVLNLLRTWHSLLFGAKVDFSVAGEQSEQREDRRRSSGPLCQILELGEAPVPSSLWRHMQEEDRPSE